jgi:hypothetical protein
LSLPRPLMRGLPAALLVLLLPAGPVPAADGAALHAAECTQCHGAEMYQRSPRKVQDFSGLGRQVRRCTQALDVTWFDEEVAAVTRFLNDQHYHFPTAAPAGH